MATWQRTHTCGELRAEHEGTEAVLCGWIENRRDHGQVVFLDVRDRYGVTQATFDPDGAASAAMVELASRLGQEDVISVRGAVRMRQEANPNRPTGAIELDVQDLVVLNEADPPPFEVLDDPEAGDELRMRYRYLDLRRGPMARTLEARSRFVIAVRNYLQENSFVDVETPILTKSTPEGARDYLVPSRVNPGQFYALPQSPQIFKQLLMVAGLDRYYQIARCFRDEDLRADRQPEFTQIDLEMSFVEEADVLDLVEGMMVRCMKDGFGIDLPTPFPRLTYDEAQRRFGNDKPDMRFGMELVDVSEAVKDCAFKVFSGTVERGGMVAGLVVEGAAERYSRKDVEKTLTAFVGEYGAKGLAWGKVGAEGITGSIGKFFADEAGQKLIAAMGAKDGDLLLFVADDKPVVRRALGELRVRLGTELGLRPTDVFHCNWVTDFPMFEWSEDKQRWESSHHPFTAPADWDADLDADPSCTLSRAYDLTMNGWELGSGSVRIHRRDVQEKVFRVLGINEEEQRAKFGFLLDAFRYGAPPHAGIALGVDRIVTLATGSASIRDVIAFPKTTSAQDLMCEAPSAVAEEQLRELYLESKPPSQPAPEAASDADSAG